MWAGGKFLSLNEVAHHRMFGVKVATASLAIAVLLLLAAFPVVAKDTNAVSVNAQGSSTGEVTASTFANYLNRLEKGFARFSQLNADGTTSKGTILVMRPSYVRIEYDPPAMGLVIADRYRVAVFDLKTKMAPYIFPLASTPLYYLLSDATWVNDPDVMLESNIGADTSEIVLRNPISNNIGGVRLRFNNSPPRLIGWTYSDQFNQTTQMNIDSIITNVDINTDLFDIDGEIRRLSQR